MMITFDQQGEAMTRIIPPVEVVLQEIATRTQSIEQAKAERRLLLDQLRVSEGARRQDRRQESGQ